MKRQTHYLLFTITLALTVVCGVLMTRVNVNADMTKYLPDDSQMKYGLDIVTEEFSAAANVAGADVHVMFDSIEPAEISGISTLLMAYDAVADVSYRYSADSAHTVFDLTVPKSVDQKALGRQISNRFGGNCVVETSQDGATPPISVMIIAAVLIMLVLFLMAHSWFEPIVILISTGMAIVLNMGTNALLPSVSITTNFIGSILQAVLSLDYCVILLNRYRQEQDDKTDRITAGIAANKAIKAAAPSVLSSALTTIVGLLMLCFMRLKIGADMGVVLAKGVMCSLICTFTVMPSLMLLFRRVINKTVKRIYLPPTDGLARFVTSHKVSMAIGATVLFLGSWYLSQRTAVFFSANAESKIEKVFPSPNPFILIYDTEEEAQICALADSLANDSSVQSIISYPTLLGQQLTPVQMINHVSSLTALVADQMPEGMSLSSPEAQAILSPEMVQIVYYMRANQGQEPTLTFPELARFLHTHCVSNPLFASYINEDMRKQVELLQSMLEPAAPAASSANVKSKTKKTATPAVVPADSIKVKSAAQKTKNESIASATDSSKVKSAITNQKSASLASVAELPSVNTKPTNVTPEVPAVERIAVAPFIERLNNLHTSALTIELHKLTDTTAIRLPMSVNEMAFFIGSTPTQTRLVYGYAPAGKKKLSPLQYVHLLTDDLFQRVGLQGLISPEQRTQLSLRANLMDMADEGTELLPSEIKDLLHSFGIDQFSEEQILDIAHTEIIPSRALAEDDTEQTEETIASADSTTTHLPVINQQPTAPAVALADSVDIKSKATNQQSESLASATDSTKVKSKITSQKPKVPAPTTADLQAELFTELAFGNKKYTPSQMSQKLTRLMKLSSVKADPITPEQMSLLYAYYGSVHSTCDTMRLGLDQLLAYICDTLIYDARLAPMIDDSVRTQVSDIHQQVTEGIGQLRQQEHSLMVVLTNLPIESDQTYAFTDSLIAKGDQHLAQEHFYLGESVMYSEMKAGFKHEVNYVTLLTIIAIFLIVAFTFRSVIVPIILVVTVMTAFYVNVVMAGVISGQILYLAYLIVQAILMGATIDYGILFANYYRENRRTLPQYEAVCAAYRGSIRTILTSGIIMVFAPGIMAVLIEDLMISNIVRSIAIGAFVAVVLILTVVPAVLVALDRLVVYGKKNRFYAPKNTSDDTDTDAENTDTVDASAETIKS